MSLYKKASRLYVEFGEELHSKNYDVSSLSWYKHEFVFCKNKYIDLTNSDRAC